LAVNQNKAKKRLDQNILHELIQLCSVKLSISPHTTTDSNTERPDTFSAFKPSVRKTGQCDANLIFLDTWYATYLHMSFIENQFIFQG
jgi:hypothetical protein